MEKRMSVMGIGHKAGAVVGAYLALTALVSWLVKPVFTITQTGYGTLLTIGVVLIIVGFTCNLIAAFQMLAAHKRDTLATTGFYKLFLNPMYFLMLWITLPGVTLLFNSWLVLTAVPVSIIVVKRFVKEEYSYLEKRYGSAYREYHKSVLFKF